MSQVAEISDGNADSLDWADFLTNCTNKQIFVSLSEYKLELPWFKAVLCPYDTDKTFVRASLQVQY